MRCYRPADNPAVPMPCPPRMATALLALPLGAAGFTLEAGPAAGRYDSVERLGGMAVLNRETGSLRGAVLAARAEGGPLAFGLRVERLAGTVAYEGRTQIGLPLSTETRLVRRSAEITLAPADPWPLFGLQWRPALGWQGLRVHRAIQPSAVSTALTETLRRHALGLSMQAAATAGRLAWTAEAGGAWPVSQRLAVDSFGVLDRFALQPEGGDRLTLRLAVAWALGGGWRLQAEGGRERDRVGASPAALVTRGGVPAAISLYPGSRQWSGRAGLAIVHTWP